MFSFIAQQMWWELLQTPTVLTGLILAVLGMFLVLFASRITMFVRKRRDISSGDKIFILMKGFGLVFLLVALVVMIVPS